MRSPLRSLFISAAVLAAVVSAAFVFRPGLGVANPGINLVPFSFVAEWLAPRQSASFTYNTLGNFILFVPTAVLLRLAGVRRLAVLAAVLGLAVTMEAVQLLLGNRVVDIDDVVLAGLGALAVVAVQPTVEPAAKPLPVNSHRVS